MTPEALERRLHQHRIPSRRVRTTAIRQLVLQAPAPVVAKIFDYSQDHTPGWSLRSANLDPLRGR